MPNEFVIKNGYISQGNSIVNGSLTATTYYGNGSLLTGIVTGFTYNDLNKLTVLRNGLPNLDVYINTMSGLTVNGNLSVTGNSTFNDVVTNSISASTYYGSASIETPVVSSTTVYTTIVSATTIYVEGQELDSGPSNLFNYYNFI